MDQNNLFNRFIKIFYKTSEIFQDIQKKPTRFLYIFPGIVLVYSLIFYFLLYIPNLWKNLFNVQFSGEDLSLQIAIFFGAILIFVVIFLLSLSLVNFTRRLITKTKKNKSKKSEKGKPSKKYEEDGTWLGEHPWLGILILLLWYIIFLIVPSYTYQILASSLASSNLDLYLSAW